MYLLPTHLDVLPLNLFFLFLIFVFFGGLGGPYYFLYVRLFFLIFSFSFFCGGNRKPSNIAGAGEGQEKKLIK
jgi:hypothetical protein